MEEYVEIQSDDMEKAAVKLFLLTITTMRRQ